MADKTVVDLDHKLPDLQKQRRQKKKRRLLVYVSLLLLFAAAVVYLETSLSHVASTSVSGLEHADEEEIISLAGIDAETSMVTMQTDDIADAVEEHALIKEASVSRSGFRSVLIDAVEYDAVAAVAEADDMFLLESGEVMPLSGESRDLPVLEGFGEDAYAAAAPELTSMDEPVFHRISDIVYDADGEGGITLYMTDGYTVRSTLQDLASRMSSYPSIAARLEPDAEGTIHMRVNPYFEAAEDADEEEMDGMEEPEAIE
ncbi:cell division protein FtsQ/DivIB [Alkalicoccus chagannorensis]|uniref:cell division protein FtsQ/DivIB n=1 Tax=Alkalicoccus chagannorensis TaxID=427072 RepID=UPI00040DF9E2|nr:FtsQ-type POTRA domain-containing protein [Alkalicoccus chagannorensis]